MINYSRVEITPEFKKLLYFFNKLEKDLQYPNCEGYQDEKFFLLKAQQDLLMWGKI